MGDTDPERMRRVEFVVPERDVDELMAHLGEFAATHYDIQITFAEADSPETSLVVITEAENDFNERLVSWFDLPDAEAPTPLITKDAMHNFELSHYHKSGLTERVVNALTNRFNLQGNEMLFTDYYVLSSDRRHFLGFRADRFAELVTALDSTPRPIQRYGNGSHAFMQTVLGNLYTPSQDD